VIAVNRAGRRFVNESDSYHCFVEAMFANGGANAPCWLICDSDAMNNYGMGLARPRPVDNSALIDAGYLLRADSLAELARIAGIDASALAQTLAQYNADAEHGVDRQFGKGSTAYNRYMGDPLHQPNPCLAVAQGAVLRRPFVYRRPWLGPRAGHQRQARVLDRSGAPIPGLYAAGNEMNSIMDGTYPGPGITLGPGITFGYLAASDIAGRLDHTPHNHPALENSMYYELRTYTIKPTRLGDWLSLYKSAALAVQQEHLGNLIGFFTTKSAKPIKWCTSGATPALTIAWPAATPWRPIRAGRSSHSRTRNWTPW
jgi:hypothetical protein